jgi:hypothetical protein
VRHTQDRPRVRLPAGRPIPVEPRPVPGHRGLMVPAGARSRRCLRRRGRPRPGRGPGLWSRLRRGGGARSRLRDLVRYGLLARSNRRRLWLRAKHGIHDRRHLREVSGGPGTWVLGWDRRHRPSRLRIDLDRSEETGVQASFAAGDPRTDRTRDGDRGEQGDERQARDDFSGSHVCADGSTSDG